MIVLACISGRADRIIILAYFVCLECRKDPTVVFCFLFSFISWQTRPHTCFSLKMFANDQIVGFSIENLAIIVFGFKHF